MARDTYQSHLNQLEEDVLYLSELATERIRYTLNALEDKDERKAQEVIEGGYEVDHIYLDLEQDCVDLLVLQQPVASDLQSIVASFKIITDLERIGDPAANLVQYAIDAEDGMFAKVGIRHIGDAALDMADQAMDAYELGDIDLYRPVAERGGDLDATYNAAPQSIVHDLVSDDDFEGDGDLSPEAALVDVCRSLLMVRDLERTGDHAVNAAARTSYMIDSDDLLLF